MKIAELLLAQVEREIDATRKTIERVPEGKDDWKPHPKSMAMGYLASLVSAMFGWITLMIEKDHLDLGGGGASASTTEGRLAIFDKSVTGARNALANVSEEHLMRPWQLRVGGKVVDEKPRHIMIADTLSHLAHHRAQLGVYLRMNDLPVPSIYGPAADEGWKPS